MKNLTRIFCLSLLMLCSVFTLSAQKKGKVDLAEKAKMETAAITANLGLDEATVTKLTEINLLALEENRVIQKEFKEKKKAGEEVSAADKKETKKGVWKKANSSIKELLGKENFKAYQTARKEYKKSLKAGKMRK